MSLSTNGQFPERIEDLYKKFPNLAKSYRFSIDGATRKTYEDIRKGASFDKLIESLEVIDKINNGRKNARISLAIGSIFCMTNMFEIPTFFEVYEKYCWPERITFSIVNGLSPDSRFFRKEFPFPNLIRRAIPCNMPFNHIYYTYNGKATLCCRDYEEDLVIGDIQENSIIELWNSPKAESIREKHLNRERMDIQACRKCFTPYDFICDIVDEYIHLLLIRNPNLTPRQFGDKLLFLLNSMDSALQKDKDRFKQVVLDIFIQM